MADRRRPSWPIPAPIRVRLAARCNPDSGAVPLIRAVVVTRQGCSGVLGGVGCAGLLCGIGQGQKRAAYGVGRRGDTSPRNGCCARTFG